MRQTEAEGTKYQSTNRAAYGASRNRRIVDPRGRLLLGCAEGWVRCKCLVKNDGEK
jgi:hypothetical protein